MKIYYCEEKNFGDEINSWMWSRLLEGDLEKKPDLHLSGIGTILSDNMPLGKEWIVFGSGVGYRPKPIDFGGDRWRILAVRGRLTAAILGLADECAVTDSAILLGALPECSSVPEEQRRNIAFMPHITANRFDIYRQACGELGINYIDPTGGSLQIIQQIRYSKLIIADAMHAAIVADTLRVPWIPVATSSAISSFKWIDWTSSMDMAYEPLKLPAPSGSVRLKDSVAAFFGKKFLLSDNSEAAALKDFRARQRLSSNKYYDKYVNVGEALARALLSARGRRKAVGAPEGASPVAPSNDALAPDVAAMVATLRSAAHRAPFLSRDAVYHEKLGTMLDKLSKLKAVLDQ